MPKIVPSFELQLKRKNEVLELENAQLRADIERQKIEIKRLSMLTYGKQLHKTALPSKKLTIETPSNTPSYLRPTAASIARAVKPAVVEEAIDTVDDRSRMYVDGKLVVVSAKPRPHYMLAKGSARGNWGWDLRDEEEKTLWVTYSRPASPTTTTYQMRYECESCNSLDLSWRDESAHSLAARSRLDDTLHKFQGSPAACVNIPYRTENRLLFSAFTIAQDIIWHHLRVHCPSRQIEHCFEGPREVRLCRGELLSLIAGVSWNLKNHAMTFTLKDAVVEVTDLRHTLAHQNRVSLHYLDVLIARVQKLAVVCMDEKRAFKVRRLRDELRTHAEKAVADIYEKYHGQWGPFRPEGRQWALHHQRTFHDLTCAYEKKEMWRYNPAPEVVKFAAWEWAAENRNCALGQLNYEYVAAFEKATTQLTETGRMTPVPEETTAEEWAEIWPAGMAELEKNAREKATKEAVGIPHESKDKVLDWPDTAW